MNRNWVTFLPELIRTKLDGRNTLQEVLANTIWLLVDKILRMVVGLVVVIWIARYLGPDQFGIYNYALAFVALFSVFATLGLDRIVVRDIVKEPAAKNKTLGTAFVLKFINGFLTILICVEAISLLRPTDNLTRWFVGIISARMVFQAFDVIDLWFQSQIQSRYTVYAKNAAFLVASIGQVCLILLEAPLIAFAWISLAEMAIGSVGLIIAYRFTGNLLRHWKGSLSRSKELLKDSWPLILSGIAVYIQARIDQVMLGEMIGAGEVGQYSVAMRLIEAFGFIPVMICASVSPMVTKSKLQGQAIYYERLLNLYRLMVILFLITAIPIFLFSKQIVILLFGEEYQAAGVLLALFSIRLFFANLGVAKGLYITNDQLFKYSLVAAIVGAMVNVGLNYVLIPVYASIGAIWATIVSFSISIFVIDFFYPRMRDNLKIMLMATVTPWRLKL
jgi:O-antigen/teichoic acid export membrane protein